MKRFLVLLCCLAPAAAPAAGLVDYVVENGAAIPAPLSAWSGGPAPGEALYASAGCAGCHDGGEAPGLVDIARRLTVGEIRLMIVEPRILFPETRMPSYYAPGRFGEAPEEMVGETRLTAREIEQIIVYLLGPATP